MSSRRHVEDVLLQECVDNLWHKAGRLLASAKPHCPLVPPGLMQTVINDLVDRGLLTVVNDRVYPEYKITNEGHARLGSGIDCSGEAP